MSDDLTGRRLGHYRIDGVIGRGGMSVMYRATDMRLGRKVALKVIGDQLAADPEFRERFVDEARNTSAIDHAHVVPLYDFDEIDGRLYIAMRYVEGSDLASLIKDGPISSTRTLTLLGQVADALDALHGRGLVHLDVKPANVLVTHKESAGTEHVYLADFGLTRRGATGHRTRSGDFLGSPTYAAPEHLRGEPVDGRTDQYSLTCVLFACLTGRPPFAGKVPDVIAGHLGSEPPAVTKLALLPAQLDDVVRRGMAKEPAQRYASCRELLTAARAALASTPVPGTRPPGGDPLVTGSPPPVAAAGLAHQPGATHQPGQPGQGQPAQPGQHGQPGLGPAGLPTYQAPGQHANGWAAQGQPPSRAYPPPYPPTGHPSSQAPIRLRDPLPVQSTAFARTGSGGSWVIPALLGLTAVVVIVIVVLLAVTREQDGGGPGQTTSPTINLPSESRTLPTNVPTVTTRR